MLVENTSSNFNFSKKITPQNNVRLKSVITALFYWVRKVNQQGIYQTPCFI